MSRGLAGLKSSPRPPVVQPEAGERGREKHPAWALLGASRVNQGPAGAVLFDSDIQHNSYVVIRLAEADRTRSLMRDRHTAGRRIVEVAMSEAQWASFVSSMNVGDGVPCTLRFREGVGEVPGMPYQPRLQESMVETRKAAHKALQEVRVRFAAYEERKTAANLRALKAALANSGPNIEFAADSLTEHAENVVQKARADIEAMVVAKAEQLGIEPGDLAAGLQLSAGEEPS